MVVGKGGAVCGSWVGGWASGWVCGWWVRSVGGWSVGRWVGWCQWVCGWVVGWVGGWVQGAQSVWIDATATVPRKWYSAKFFKTCGGVYFSVPPG